MFGRQSSRSKAPASTGDSNIKINELDIPLRLTLGDNNLTFIQGRWVNVSSDLDLAAAEIAALEKENLELKTSFATLNQKYDALLSKFNETSKLKSIAMEMVCLTFSTIIPHIVILFFSLQRNVLNLLHCKKSFLRIGMS